MFMPRQSKPVARKAALSLGSAVTASGCCAQVCLPFVGCHCVLDLPICPG